MWILKFNLLTLENIIFTIPISGQQCFYRYLMTKLGLNTYIKNMTILIIWLYSIDMSIGTLFIGKYRYHNAMNSIYLKPPLHTPGTDLQQGHQEKTSDMTKP